MKQTLYPVNSKIRSIPGFPEFLHEYKITRNHEEADIYAGWGRKKSMRLAQKIGPSLCLEDGFLRSVDFCYGEKNPPLSLVTDKTGIYFDATQPSDLENMLNSDILLDFTRAENCIKAIRQYRLSKYNNGREYSARDLGIPQTGEKVLLIDQCYGDASIKYGLASQNSFDSMIKAARDNHPGATMIIKTHPDGKRGYLKRYFKDSDVIVLSDDINPHCLFDLVEHVYAVTSLLGFEAAMADKKVHVFGMPFYAGWGAMAEEQQNTRRNKTRTAAEIFAASYINYARYYDPNNEEKTDIENVIDILATLKKQRFKNNHTYHCIGFKHWKRTHIWPFLADTSNSIKFHNGPLKTSKNDCIISWGITSTANTINMEDGFIRSIGLGSDLLPASSLILDKIGIYYDPRTPSELENILNDNNFSNEELQRAQTIHQKILKEKLSKYNSYAVQFNSNILPKNRKVILVPGQVSNDDSIQYGATGLIKTNLTLLQSVRESNPSAYIIYKPHPDVTIGNRIGYIPRSLVLKYADIQILDTPIPALLPHVNEVHTMTSFVGFEALLHEKKVTCYGTPFYAEWGLTKDLSQSTERRQTKLTLNALITGTLIRYPRYFDWHNKIPCTPEKILLKLGEDKRNASKANKNIYTKFINQGLRVWRYLKLTSRGLIRGP